MEKPTKYSRPRYDYLECSQFLEEKYNYKERDYAGLHKFHNDIKKQTDEKFGKNGWYETAPKDFTPEQLAAHEYYVELKKNEPPYLDFWHFVLDQDDIHNGSIFTMYKEWEDGAEPWQKEILKYFFDEFDPENTGEIDFSVSW